MNAPIRSLRVQAFRIPTEEQPETDGTGTWSSTTLVVVEIDAGGAHGLGYTYADSATARFIEEVLRSGLEGADAFDIPRLGAAMLEKVRNHGRAGVAAMAISAVDTALWDLKARALGVPLFRLLGQARDAAETYASGGFTSYSEQQLIDQLTGWARSGFRRVKMKVGRDFAVDVARVKAARAALGPDVELFVDANGAWDRKQALRAAEVFGDLGVCWFEEPVSSDDLDGLRLLRDRAPTELEITAGEYGYNPHYFRRMLEAGAVDVMMADASRCLGFSGYLATAALCDAFSIPLSAHCAPSLHLPVALCAPRHLHLEYFHDHQRIERMLFDGAPQPRDGRLVPDPARPGLGLELKKRDAEKFAI